MADPKPWEVEYEDPKPWEISYEKPIEEQPSLLGKSKIELQRIAKQLRVERNLGGLEQGATDVATGFLSIPGAIGSKIFNIPTELPKSVERPLVDAEKIKQTLDPITEAWGMSGEPATEASKEVAAETTAGLTSPESIGVMATGPAAPVIFATEMAKAAPAAIQNLQEVSKTGDEKETAKAFLNAALSIGGPIAIARQAGLVKEQPAAEAAQPERTTDARTQQEAATLHGNVREQSIEGEGQVPVKKGSEGVQPQTEGGIPKEEVTPASTLETVIRDPQQRANNKNSTEAGMAVKSVEDLDALVDLRKRLLTESKELFKKSEAETDPAKKMELMNQGALIGVKSQLPREAIEVATNFGGWEEGKGSIPHKLGERPLDYSKNPEVIDWLHKNKDIFSAGVEIPAKAEKAAAPEPTETVLASRHGTTHGLPPGVPDRGPSFAADLMEASRQLGALVRSRATLRPGVLGQFVRSKLAGIKQSDRIEVGDIRNQATVAHEIGHSLDGILFPDQNFGESQKSLAARVGTGTGKELASELTKVSELMRGPMTGSKGHIAYRKRATELLADYFSLYAHDKDRAAAMAPKFTKGFEAALAKDRNTADVVKGVVAGNVVPRPPSTTLPKALAGITRTAPQPGTKIPGQVPAPPPLIQPARERVAAVAAEGLVKDAVRTFESKVQKARIVGDDWRKRVASQSDRNDVGAFVEGIGNLEKPGDTIDRVRTRMTPAKERLAKDYRFRQELERQEINSYLKGTEEGEYLKFLEDYLGHFYVDSTAKRQAAVSRWAKESPHAKQRKIPTLKEAVDLGLTPITQDPAVTYELNSRINWQVATNRKFVAKLKDLKTGGGADIVVPAKDAPAGWPVTSNPLIQRVYARQTPSGLMLWRGGAAIHPDVWRAARQILEAPIAGDLGKAYDAINGFTRANAFAFSMFHDLTLRSAAIGSQASPLNPLRGLFRVMEQHPVTGERKIIQSTRGLGKELLQNEEAVADAAQHGLKFSYTDSEAYQHNARTFLERRAAAWRDVPVLGKATRLARDLQQWRQEGLWKNTHDAFKIVTYNDLVSKALQDAPPGTDTKAVKEQIASYLNDAYGGQEWQTKFWLDPGTRKVLSRFFLAPDWCVDEKTRAMTKRGWKYHHELRVGDEIMGFNPDTKQIQWLELKDKYENPNYLGPMVCIKNYFREIMMTPDHTCYVFNTGKGRHEIVKAHEFNTRHMIPRCADYDLPDCDGDFSDRFIRIVGWFVTDGYTKRSVYKAVSGKTCEYFYGKITQSKPQMVEVLKEYEMPFHLDKIPIPHISPSGVPIVTNHQKHTFTIPTDIFRRMQRWGLDRGLNWEFLSALSRRQLELLYSTMMLGDGTGQNRFCGQEQEVFYMTLIQTLLGKPTTFYQQESKCWRTRIVCDKEITVRGHNTQKVIGYSGLIWCPSVETGFWLAERNGLIFITGNTLSTIRSVPGISDVVSTAREHAPRIAGRETFPTPKEGIGGVGRRLRFWGSEIAALAMATAAAQYAIYKTFGDDKKGDKAFPWDNELNQKMRIDVTPLMRKFPWHDPKDPTRNYVNLGKRPQEILNWFTEPDKQIMSKASRPVAMIFEQVTGSEGDFKAQWKQDHESFIESVGSRAKAIGTEALPFTFRGNQFALSAPVRKGMTKYKAQQAYESVFELATNPSRIRSLLRGQPASEGTIPEMASQITDAAHRNGVPAEEVMVRALSTVRGHHYNEFFKAFQKGDQKKMDEEAKALMILGATNKGIEESLKRRMELQPQAQ